MPLCSSSLSFSPGWHEDLDRKMSQTSLGQDQAKFGSKSALNRRVIVILIKFIFIVQYHVQSLVFKGL